MVSPSKFIYRACLLLTVSCCCTVTVWGCLATDASTTVREQLHHRGLLLTCVKITYYNLHRSTHFPEPWLMISLL
jgi:hypothetical protein